VAEEVAADAAAAEEHHRQDRPRLRLRHLDSRIGFGSSRPEIRALSVFLAPPFGFGPYHAGLVGIYKDGRRLFCIPENSYWSSYFFGFK
jgi:hypothetical protein